MIELSEQLQELCIREATIQEVLRQLRECREENEAELEELSGFKHFLRRRSTDRKTERTDLRDSIIIMNQAIAHTDELRERIHSEIEYHLERHLREGNNEYRQGLEARSCLGDLLRCLDFFKVNLANFRNAVGVLRNTACAGYDKVENRYSQAAYEAYEEAWEAAKLVRNDVYFLNDLRSKHNEVASDERFSFIQLPELPEGKYLEMLSYLMSVPIVEAMQYYPILLDELDELENTGIDEIKQEIELAEKQHGRLSNSYIGEIWEQINRHAAESWVDQERLNQEIEALEERYRMLA